MPRGNTKQNSESVQLIRNQRRAKADQLAEDIKVVSEVFKTTKNKDHKFQAAELMMKLVEKCDGLEDENHVLHTRVRKGDGVYNEMCEVIENQARKIAMLSKERNTGTANDKLFMEALSKAKGVSESRIKQIEKQESAFADEKRRRFMKLTAEEKKTY
jgi:hypothetical protein